MHGYNFKIRALVALFILFGVLIKENHIIICEFVANFKIKFSALPLQEREFLSRILHLFSQ